MNAPASRRILQLAFVVSILVHVVAAAATHGLRQVHAAPPQPPTTLHIFRVATPPPTPPPTP
ncbi:MAG: M56 family metallopeptidase, partial [Vulcanimicrobiaceae bacterium]